MFSFNDKKNSNCKLTIMDQQFKNYIGNTAWLGIIIVKTRLTMSNWSSEAVNQRRDNIITKGKNDKTIKWLTTDNRNTFCIRLFFSFYFFFYFSVLASRAVNRGFETRSGQTKDYEIDMCCVFAKYAALRSKSKDWLDRNQNNVSKWNNMATRGLLVQWASSIQIQLCVLV